MQDPSLPAPPPAQRPHMMVRQLSSGSSSESATQPQSQCFICVEPVVRNAADSLRLGCQCVTHYHCLIAYLQDKIGDRASMNDDGGIGCPYGTSCGSSSPYFLTLEDMDTLVDYKTADPERAQELDALLSENGTQQLSHEEVAELRSWLEQRSLHEALRTWLGDPALSFDNCVELVKVGVQRNDAFAALLLQQTRGATTDAVTESTTTLPDELRAELAALAVALRKGFTSEVDPFVLATTKACPSCGVRASHFHGHHCHHISPTTNGCPNCHIGYCYRCMATETENRAQRGDASSCKCGSWSNFCSAISSAVDVKEHIALNPQGVPFDKRCGCTICSLCRQDQPCPECDGSCSVCRGFLNPGPQGLGEIWVARRLKRCIKVKNLHKEHPLVSMPTHMQCWDCDSGPHCRSGKTEGEGFLPDERCWRCRECGVSFCTACCASSDEIDIPEQLTLGAAHPHPLTKVLKQSFVCHGKSCQSQNSSSSQHGESFAWCCSSCSGDEFALCLPCLLSTMGVSDYTTGPTPLITAICSRSSTGIISAILAKNPEQAAVVDDDGTLPLILAVQYKLADVTIAAILAAFPDACQAANSTGGVPLHYAVYCHSSLETIGLILSTFPEAVGVASTEGSLPLFWALHSKAPLNIIELLTELAPHSLEEHDQDGQLPLHEAATAGYHEAVSHILRIHPEQASDSVTGRGEYALHCAASAFPADMSSETVRVLLAAYPEAAQKTLRDGSDCLPLHLACSATKCAPLEVFSMLLDAHPEGVKAKNASGMLPLHLAAEAGAAPEVILKLLQAFPDASKEKEGKNGRLALHLLLLSKAVARSSSFNLAPVVNALLEANPDSAKEEDPNGWNALMLAIKGCASEEVICALINANPCAAEKSLESSLTLESPHPYLDSTDDYETVSIPGADEVIIAFDPQTRTENNYDYVRFYHDETHDQYWGDVKYSGRDDTRSFPGLDGMPPLVIKRSKFVLYFHSDGSNNDWGYKFTVSSTCLPPLHTAIQNNASLGVIAALLQAFPDGAKKETKAGELPLHLAARTKAPVEIIVALLQAYPEAAVPVDVAVPADDTAATTAAATDTGRALSSPLLIAAESKAPTESILALLAAHPAAAAVKNSAGVLPLHAAATNGASLAVVAALLEAYPQGSRIKDGQGRRPLQLAMESKASPDVIAALQPAAGTRLTRTIGTFSLTLHTTPSHSLTLAPQRMGWSCDGRKQPGGCKSGGDGENMYAGCAFSCKDCSNNFLLCVSCATHDVGIDVLLTLQSSLHPAHPLTKAKCQYKSVRYGCDGCAAVGGCRSGGGDGALFKGFSWHCDECNFDLCAHCAVAEMGVMDRWPTPLLAAICSDSPELVLQSLEKDPEAAKVKDDDGTCPLARALQLNAPLSVISALLQADPESPQARNGEGKLPLTIALEKGLGVDIVSLLLSAFPTAAKDVGLQVTNKLTATISCPGLHPHACVRTPDRPNGWGCDGRQQPGGCRSGFDGGRFSTPSWCCRNCDFDLCVLCACEATSVTVPATLQSSLHDHVLVKTACPYQTGGFGCDGRHQASGCASGTNGTSFRGFTWHCRECQFDLCPFCALAEAGLSTTSSSTANNRIALHVAASSQAASVDVIGVLLAAYPEAIQKRDGAGHYALHLAVKNKASLAVVAALLDAFPDASKKETKAGELPLHLAARAKAPVEVIVALLQANSEAAVPKLNTQSRTSTSTNVDLPLPPTLPVGTVVERGPDWDPDYGDQDGGAGNRGRIVMGEESEEDEGWVHVRWDGSGDLQYYRWGAEGAYDIKTVATDGAVTAKGSSPLLIAAESKAPTESILALLAAHPAAAAVKNSAGVLPLHAAATNGASLAVVAALLEAYPQGSRIKDEQGRRPLQLAMESKASPDVIAALQPAAGTRLTRTTTAASLHTPTHTLTLGPQKVGWSCDGRKQPGGCKSGGDGENMYAGCAFSCNFNLCSFVLCVSCAADEAGLDLPLTLQSSLHPAHPLTKAKCQYRQSLERYGCDGCAAVGGCRSGGGDGALFKGFSWHCDECNFDLCPHCAVAEAGVMDRWPTPLLAAICSDSPELVLQSLEKDPEAAKVKDDDGKTPLALAVTLLQLQDSVSVVTALLDAFPDAAKQEDADGKLPLWTAVKAGAPADVIVALASAHPEAARARPKGLIIIESTHPYEDNMETLESVVMDGADELIVTFDQRSKTEGGCDYLRFYKDQSCTSQFGEEMYSGRDDSRNFPGVNGKPPLVIPGNNFFLAFKSDGSSNDWGYRITVEGTMRLPLHQLLTSRSADEDEGEGEDEDVDEEAEAELDTQALAALIDAFPGAAAEKINGSLPLHLVAAKARSADAIWLVLSANPEAACERDDTCGDLPLHIACRAEKPLAAVIAALAKAYPQAAAVKSNDGLLPIQALLRDGGKCAAEDEDQTIAALTALFVANPQSARDSYSQWEAAQGRLAALLQSAVSQQQEQQQQLRPPPTKIRRSLSCAGVHPHPLTRAMPAGGRRWQCDACHVNGGGPGLMACFAWECSACDVRVCVDCAARGTGCVGGLPVVHTRDHGSRHAHELVCSRKAEAGRVCSGVGCVGGCQSGGEIITGFAWHCSQCRDVSFCASCVAYDEGWADWWPTPLLSAIARGEEAAVIEMLQRDGPLAATADDDGNLPLTVALKCKASDQVIQALLSAHPEAARVKDGKLTRLALHWAASSAASRSSIEALVAANPAAVLEKDQLGSLPLHLSAASYSDEALQALLSAHPETATAQDGFGRTPLHLASRLGTRAFEALLAANPDGIRATDHEGRLPLHAAAAGRSTPEILAALVAAHPSGTHELDGVGRTPLELAVFSKATANTVALLLKHT